MESVTVNGVELEYEAIGSGEPVLLISPVLADGFVPLLTQPALADRHLLIRYHKRGWAGSTHTPPPVTIGDHAADAAALLEHLGIPRAHVAGHSSGAAVAAQLALDRPETVHTLILMELSLLSVPSGALFLAQAGPAFEAYASGDHARALATFMTVVSGLDWPACRALLEDRTPGAVAQAVEDADTFFGTRAARADRVGVRAAAGSRDRSARPVRPRLPDPAPVGGGGRLPALLAPTGRGAHHRRCRPSPARPTPRARRPRHGGVPAAKRDRPRPGASQPVSSARRSQTGGGDESVPSACRRRLASPYRRAHSAAGRGTVSGLRAHSSMPPSPPYSARTTSATAERSTAAALSVRSSASVPAANPADRMASASVAARSVKVTVSLSVPTEPALCRS